MLSLTMKGKDATFAMIAMPVDAQLTWRDIDDFYDNPTPTLAPPQVTA